MKDSSTRSHGPDYQITSHIDAFLSGMPNRFTIIGGGIIGCSIARELKKQEPALEVLVLEKEPRLGQHQSGRNSGVVHSGINQKPETLKAKLAVEGNKMIHAFCKTHKVRFSPVGTLVIARNRAEEKVLQLVLRWGTQVGVPNLEIIDRDRIQKLEPYAAGNTALHSPTGAIIDSVGFLRAVALDAKADGVKFFNNAQVESITPTKVKTSRGEFDPGHLINAAGLYSDKIAKMMGIGREYRVIPFRGDYMEIGGLSINSMVYPAPNLKYPFLGVHFTRSIDDKVKAGPTATLGFGRESYRKEVKVKDSFEMLISRNFWRMALSREFLMLTRQNIMVSLFPRIFLKEMQSLTTQKIHLRDIKPYRSGIRAQIVDKNGNMVNEFIIKYSKNRTNIINAISPGLTCSLAFAKRVVSRILFQ
ncbi:MAG: L-2-hydroxyglutarate oxidase [Candidatus Hodarchaeales archaeon]|jgi:L-2-hydroxyglutarate oxidase